MERKQPDLVLIRARSFATKLATPTLADSRGNLVFFNDAASEVIGRSYLDVGKLPASRWQELFEPRTFDEQPHDPMRSDRALEELYDRGRRGAPGRSGATPHRAKGVGDRAWCGSLTSAQSSR